MAEAKEPPKNGTAPKKKNPHAGHRKRMRLRFAETGLRGFHPHEALELLLYHAIPRRDINPLCHDIIDRMGSLDATLRASEKELLAIPQVGPQSVFYIRLVSALADQFLYATEHASERIIHDPQSIVTVLANRLKEQTTPVVIGLYLDCGNYLKLAHSFSEAQFPTARELLALAGMVYAESIILFQITDRPIRDICEEQMPALLDLMPRMRSLECPIVDFCIWNIGDKEFFSCKRTHAVAGF